MVCVSEQERREKIRKEYGVTPYSKGAELDPHRHDEWRKKALSKGGSH